MEVLDPNRWWDNDEASIENVDIYVKPTGQFTEIQIEFDLFAENNFYSGTNVPLEYVLNFDMPEQAVFNRSLLWIGSYISEGEIYEAVEGTAIYEGIVNRQQDPSILTKHNKNHYSLRVYPLDPDSTRRVLLSYLLPLELKTAEGSLDLPTHILNSSKRYPENISIHISDNDYWTHINLEPDTYREISNSGFTKIYRVNQRIDAGRNEVSYLNLQGNPEYLFGTYSNGNQSYYQLTFFPDYDLPQTGETYLFCLDYNHENTQVSQESLIEDIKSSVLEHLDENDKFNICYSNFVTRFAFNEFVIGSPENVNLAFENIMNNGLGGYDKLEVLLPVSLDHVNMANEEVVLLLISNSTSIFNINDVNDFYEEIDLFSSNLSNLASFSIIDYASINRVNRFINGINYSGNEYLYDRLAQLFNGRHYSTVHGDNIVNALENSLISPSRLTDIFDIDLDATGGFSYHNYLNSNNSNSLDLDKPISMIGKYYGEFPFTLQINGFANEAYFETTVEIQENQAYAIDDVLAEKTWYGSYLLNNENSENNDIRREVVETSMEQGLLCRRTVFLCLEPDSLTISDENFDIDDDDLVLSNENINTNKLALNCYPNPSSGLINLEITGAEDAITDTFLLSLIDMFGRVIHTEVINFTVSSDKLTTSWQAPSFLESGTYIAKIQSESVNVSQKIILIR